MALSYASPRIISVSGSKTQLERAKIRERTQRGRRARIDSGRISPGAKDLYGYATDRTLGRRSEKPEEAAIVRQIFSWVGAEGIGVRTVIRRLNDLGIPPPSAGHFRYKDGRTPRWGKGTLQRILAEPAYKGQAYGLRWGAKRREGAKWKSPFYKPREEWVALHETTPALVAESVWDAAQGRASLNAGSTVRNAQKPYLLRGLISCATCGRPMRTNPEKGKHTYRCSARETPAGACGGARASAEVEAEVLWAARWHVSNPDYMLPPPLQAEDRTIEHLRVDAEAARSTIARLDRSQERLVARFSAAEDETTFPWQVVEREISRLETEKQGWAKTLADIETRSAARSHAHEQRELVWKWSATVAGHYGVGKAFAGLGLPQPEMTFAEQRGLLEALGVRVYANGRDWRLEAEFDPTFVAGNGHPIRSLRGSSTRPAVVTFSLGRADFQTLRSAA